MDADVRPSGIGEQSPESSVFTELQVVKLVAELRMEDGVFPSGSEGAVVHAYPDAAAYEVEFLQPQQAVVTLRADQLAAA